MTSVLDVVGSMNRDVYFIRQFNILKPEVTQLSVSSLRLPLQVHGKR